MSIRAILIIARLTLREASRRRLLLAVVVLTFVLVGISAWGFERITSSPCSADGDPCSPVEQKFLAAILLTLITFMYSFLFALGAVFVAAPVISTEVESGVLLAVLPRPLHRKELVLGKWLGVATLIGGYAIVTTGAEFIAVSTFVGYTPPHPLWAIAFLVGESLVMLTLALAFSTRLAPMTGGIIALVLFGLAWMGGIAQTIGAALNSDTVSNVGLATKLVLPADGLWRGALYSIQPSFVDAIEAATYTDGDPSSNPFFVLNPPSEAYIAWAVTWIVLMLGLATFSFSRRDI
jgi:ABC-type transport system involved in multi-copper enzyme maturation permease subunit